MYPLSYRLGPVAVLVGFSLAVPARSQDAAGYETGRQRDLAVSLRFGASYQPTYPDADSAEFGPELEAELVWRDRLFIGTRGIGGYFVSNDRLRLGAGIGFSEGRDEADDPALRGLGNIDRQGMIVVFADTELAGFAVGASVAHVPTAGRGSTMNLSVGRDFDLSDRLTLGAGANAVWGDGKNNQTWFGVTPAQAVSSGLPTFAATSGFTEVGISLTGSYALNERWTIEGEVGVVHLLGDAADSPLTRKDTYGTASISIGLRF